MYLRARLLAYEVYGHTRCHSLYLLGLMSLSGQTLTLDAYIKDLERYVTLSNLLSVAVRQLTYVSFFNKC